MGAGRLNEKAAASPQSSGSATATGLTLAGSGGANSARGDSVLASCGPGTQVLPCYE